MRGHTFRQRQRHDPGDLFDAGRPQLRDAAEAPQQLLRRARADAGNVREACLDRAFRPPLSVEAYGEAMGFIANLLDQMEDR